ncbi:MAG TPA: arsenate reductase (glutaredoxin) [Acidimicrobiales bacterium]|jgi:arsenate reductase|nr:arsenate reductase (glutaredoxin) [Acidimicrobiales bacterium]
MADAVQEPITIYFNAQCSKSRQALALIEDQGEPYTVIEYLKTPPDRSTLEAMLGRLQGPAIELIRTEDPAFRELDLDKKALATPASVADFLVSHPELMQRPVVLRGDMAVIARPPELVARVLD